MIFPHSCWPLTRIFFSSFCRAVLSGWLSQERQTSAFEKEGSESDTFAERWASGWRALFFYNFVGLLTGFPVSLSLGAASFLFSLLQGRCKTCVSRLRRWIQAIEIACKRLSVGKRHRRHSHTLLEEKRKREREEGRETERDRVRERETALSAQTTHSTVYPIQTPNPWYYHPTPYVTPFQTLKRIRIASSPACTRICSSAIRRSSKFIQMRRRQRSCRQSMLLLRFRPWRIGSMVRIRVASGAVGM